MTMGKNKSGHLSASALVRGNTWNFRLAAGDMVWHRLRINTGRLLVLIATTAAVCGRCLCKSQVTTLRHTEAYCQMPGAYTSMKLLK